MHCMLMDLLHGFEVLSTTEETLFNSRNVSRLLHISSHSSLLLDLQCHPSQFLLKALKYGF